MLRSVPRILGSPAALSSSVLLLQIPLACTLAFGTRITELRSHPFILLSFAVLFLSGASLCFFAGNRAFAKFPRLQRGRTTITCGIWLLTGFQCVAISQFAHLVTGGTDLALSMKMAFVPLMWIASLFTTTHVVHSRQEYVESFRSLQQTNAALSKIEESTQQALDSERQTLIETIRNTIASELHMISGEIKGLRAESHRAELDELLTQVDGFSHQTLRRVIKDLNEDLQADADALHATIAIKAPKLVVRDLPLSPLQGLRFACMVGGAVLLPVVGFVVVMQWWLQVAVIFAPAFVLAWLRQQRPLAHKFPEITWVVLAALSILVLRLAVLHPPRQVETLAMGKFVPLVGGLILVTFLVLGSFDTLFVDGYRAAAGDQSQANERLMVEVGRNRSGRQRIRKDLARLLHGPIQGRLAAVRMKLQLLSTADVRDGSTHNAVEIEHLKTLVDQISREMDDFGNIPEQVSAVNLSDELEMFVRNWQGLVRVTFDVAPSVAQLAERDSSLASQLVAACGEVITNASRHGTASEIDIAMRISADESTIELIAQDNGRGDREGFVPGIGLGDISADGCTVKFLPCASGARLQIEFPLHAAFSYAT